MIPTQAAPPRAELDRRIGFAPWRLSGTVVGPLLNDPASLAALGDAVHAAPYKAPPRAPVLYVKPRNTLAPSGSAVELPAGEPGFDVGATLALVIGSTASRIAAADADAMVAGVVLVADLSLPQPSLYRPNVRQKALDGSCLVGSALPAPRSLRALDDVTLALSVDGGAAQALPMRGWLRPPARLIEDVTAFMTLHPGDLLLLGLRHGAPRLAAGQSFAIDGDGLGSLAGRIVAAAQGA